MELFLEGFLQLVGAAIGALMVILASVIRLGTYMFSESVREEIDGKYRDKGQWVKWWYLSSGSVAAILLIGVFALPFYLLATLPAEKPPEPHHPIRELEQSILHKIHKPHPQD